MLSDEEKKAFESVKDMFEDVTIKDIDEQSITIYGIAMLDVIRVLTIVEKQQKEIEELKEDRKKYAEEYIHNNPWLYKQLNENYILRVEADELCNKKWEDIIKAKIEELNKNVEKAQGEELLIFDSKIDVLQLLLEKE